MEYASAREAIRKRNEDEMKMNETSLALVLCQAKRAMRVMTETELRGRRQESLQSQRFPGGFGYERIGRSSASSASKGVVAMAEEL